MPMTDEAKAAIAKACSKEGTKPEALADIEARYERGLFKADRARSVRAYLNSIRESDPHLFGLKPVKKSGNPWRVDQWNATEQARLVKAIGMEAAAKIAASAGAGVGWTEKMARAAAAKRKLA